MPKIDRHLKSSAAEEATNPAPYRRLARVAFYVARGRVKAGVVGGEDGVALDVEAEREEGGKRVG